MLSQAFCFFAHLTPNYLNTERTTFEKQQKALTQLAALTAELLILLKDPRLLPARRTILTNALISHRTAFTTLLHHDTTPSSLHHIMQTCITNINAGLEQYSAVPSPGVRQGSLVTAPRL